MSADDDLIAELRAGERSVPLNQAANGRIRERMAAAFGTEQPDVAPVVDLPSYAEGRSTVEATRGRVAFIVAAASIVFLAMTAALLVPDRDTSPADDAERPDLIEDDSAARTDHDLGYLPFANINFEATVNADQTEALNITERTGARTDQADGGATLAVRRAISGSLVDANDFRITIEFTADGAILVPIEFIAPAFAANSSGCRGGSIDLNQLEQQLINAECGGDTVALTVRASAGELDSLGILAEPVRATPTTYELLAAGDVVATSTLWFDQAGIVRIDLDLDGAMRELPMTATALTRRNIDLGLTEPEE